MNISNCNCSSVSSLAEISKCVRHEKRESIHVLDSVEVDSLARDTFFPIH